MSPVQFSWDPCNGTSQVGYTLKKPIHPEEVRENSDVSDEELEVISDGISWAELVIVS